MLRATALALRETPRANAAYRDGRFELYSRVNIGIAVAAQDALVVPTIYDADTKPIAQLAAERRELIERARSGTLAPADTRGATFTFQRVRAHAYTPSSPRRRPRRWRSAPFARRRGSRTARSYRGAWPR